MLYLALRHSHVGLSALAAITTLLWVVMAWRKTGSGVQLLPKWLRTTYAVNRATVGLAGLTGLWLTLIGPWHLFLFPYLGLVGLCMHEVIAVFAKRAYLHGSLKRHSLLTAQAVCILGISWLMSVKIV